MHNVLITSTVLRNNTLVVHNLVTYQKGNLEIIISKEEEMEIQSNGKILEKEKLPQGSIGPPIVIVYK